MNESVICWGRRHQVLRKRNQGIKSRIATPSALASLSMLTSEMFRSPRSTLLTYVRCRPARSASSSCDMLVRKRILRSFSPNRVCTSAKVVPFAQDDRQTTVDREYGRVHTLSLQTLSYRNLKSTFDVAQLTGELK